jgi:hypothetical protein
VILDTHLPKLIFNYFLGLLPKIDPMASLADPDAFMGKPYFLQFFGEILPLEAFLLNFWKGRSKREAGAVEN